MAGIKSLGGRKFRVFMFNGYRADGRKRVKSTTVTIPENVTNRGINNWITAEAARLEAQYRSDYAGKAFMSFQEYAKEWLESSETLKPSTRETYMRVINLVSEYIGNMQMDEIRPLHIEKMIRQIRERPYGRKVCDNTILRYLACVSSIFTDAVHNQFIPANPVILARKPKEKIKEIVIPTQEELQKVVEELDAEPLIYRCYYMLTYMMAARRGETCALRWSDVKEDGIMINHNRVRVTGKGIVECLPKSGKAREIGLTNEMEVVLEILNKYHVFHFGKIDPDRYLFVLSNGNPISPDAVSKRFKKVVRRAGLDPTEVHLHTLRHCALTLMLENGMSKQVVAEISGHHSTAFLESRYCHPRMTARSEAAQCVSTFVLKSSPSLAKDYQAKQKLQEERKNDNVILLPLLQQNKEAVHMNR